jgi:alpha-1,3-mannosyltransferase
MIIAHVVRQYYPSVGGFEEVVKNLAKHQLAAGQQPYVITLNRYFKALDETLMAEELIEGIKVIRIPFVGSTKYPIAPSVLKHIQQADIVHVHAIDFFYDFLAITKPFHRKKLVVSTHGGFFHTVYASTFKKVFFNTVTRFSSLFYKKVIASSENDGEIFKTIVLPNKLVTIENGVDIEKLHVENKTEFPPALLYFGRWSENKGIFEALALFAKLSDQDKVNDWRFILAGRTYDLTSEDIQNEIQKLNICNKVEIHVNPTIEQLKDLTLKATYFLSLSKFEGFGIAPIEAMSAGLTPVLSDIPPFVKLVTETKNGLLIDGLKDNQAIKIINHYNGNEFGTSTLNASVQKYTWQDVSMKYLLAYATS